MNKEDKRAKKTKKALVQALSKLLDKKCLQNISINELACAADVHRSTFYAHYKDIYDLYQQSEDSVIKMIDDYIKISSLNNYSELFSSIIDYLYDNQWMCRMFFGRNASPIFQDRLCYLLTAHYIEICKQEERLTTVPTEWNILAIYHVNGYIAMVKDWVQNGLTYPKEKLADMMSSLDNCFDSAIFIASGIEVK